MFIHKQAVDLSTGVLDSLLVLLRRFETMTNRLSQGPSQLSFPRRMWGVRNPSQTALMARSLNPKTRVAVAHMSITPRHVREHLSKDSDASVRLAVAASPYTPMDLLAEIVRRNSARGTSPVLATIARRGDLNGDAVSVFSTLTPRAAAILVDAFQMPIVLGGRKGARLNPQVLEALVSIPNDSVGPHQYPFSSIFELAASFDTSCLTETTMLVIAKSGDQRAVLAMVTKPKFNPPREVAVELMKSDDWRVLSSILLSTNLTHNERGNLLLRLRASPEWLKQQETVQSFGHGQETDGRCLCSACIDRPPALKGDDDVNHVEQMFWTAFWRSYLPQLQGLVPQLPVSKYRLDFGLPHEKIGIEVDGFAWHSRQEHLISDRQRQRDIEMRGWRIIRFAAKEVMEDPVHCVQEAARFVDVVRRCRGV